MARWGYLKCVDASDINKELFKFKTPSGIIGDVFTHEHKGRQYIGVFSGIGGWAGIGMAAGPRRTPMASVPGGYKELRDYTGVGRFADCVRAAAVVRSGLNHRRCGARHAGDFCAAR
jgi:hypothetical protein